MNPRQKRINYALAATMLAAGASLSSVAEQVGAGSPQSLRVGLNRKGVTVKGCRIVPASNEENTSATYKLASQAGERLREMMGETTIKAADKLSKARLGGTVKAIRAYADALEPLSRVGDRLYGWSQSQAAPTFNVLVLEQPAQVAADQVKAGADQVIDLQEQPQPESPKPEQDKPAL